MFTRSRIALKTPESALEQGRLQCRVLRRLVVAAVCLGLLFTSLSGLSLQRNLSHQRLTRKSFELDDLGDLPRVPSRLYAEHDQQPLQKPHQQQEQSMPAPKGSQLPTMVRIPFEEATTDIELQGWEDDWFAHARFDAERFGTLTEPRIDFVYNWVNGSDEAFQSVKHKYEIQSPLNDADGKWISQHSINRYRDWDELRYSLRSLDVNARGFINKIQLLVNSVANHTDSNEMNRLPQKPGWLRQDSLGQKKVQVLSQEDFFDDSFQHCLPTFNSLSIESQIHQTPSSSDQFVNLSDDMFLGMPHSAADFYSPLFGSTMSFKPDQYNVKSLSSLDIPTFGEKPFLYYTSWLLNHRFGLRERKAQAHFSHSISRRVMKEALSSFPNPSQQGTCQRFRGESQFQIYPWYATFHYSIERFREILLWSFIVGRSDINKDGYLDWTERQEMLRNIEIGWNAVGQKDRYSPEKISSSRERMYYRVPQMLRQAGLTPPTANANILWTSLDGPETIRNLKCDIFNIDKCLAESFGSSMSDETVHNLDFSTSNIFIQLAKNEPKCGDCLTKLLLSTTPRGLEPMLPPESETEMREVVIKGLLKYQHTIVEPDGMFVMVKDAEQAQADLIDRTISRGKKAAQWCFNDDVMTEDPREIAKVSDVLQNVFETLFPSKGTWEK